MFDCHQILACSVVIEQKYYAHTHAHENFIIYNISLVVFMYMETKERRYRQRINKMMTK